MDLAGTSAVITAGANGIGRSVALGLARRGASVTIADIDSDSIDRTVAELQSIGSGMTGVVCDVTSNSDMAALAAHVLATHGPPDLLMNHAGIAIAGMVESIPLEDWHRIVDINVLSMIRGLRAFLPGMLERGTGRVVLTTSSLALLGGHPLAGFSAPYITTKSAVIGLAMSLAPYLRQRGLDITLLAPDMTDTSFPKTVKFIGAGGEASTIEAEVPYGAQTPDHVAEVLIEAIEADRFLASSTPDVEELLVRQATALLDPVALAGAYLPRTAS